MICIGVLIKGAAGGVFAVVFVLPERRGVYMYIEVE